MNEEIASFMVFFSDDDGSLPGVTLRGVPFDVLAGIYTDVCGRAVELSDANVWDDRENVDVPLSRCPDHVQWLREGRTSHVNHTVSGVSFAGVPVPVLGLFFFAFELSIDWRKGEWSPEQVAAFIYWLRNVRRSHTDLVIAHDDEVPKDVEAEFAAAFDAFCS